MLVGAGCIPVANKPVEGKWQLAFDLPSGWIMVEPYDVPSEGKIKPLNEGVRRDDSEVYLQSSNTPICLTTGGACAEGSIVNTGNLIYVTILDPHRSFDASKLTDLKNGFYLKPAPAEPTGGPAAIAREMYYLKTDKGVYQFEYMGDANTIKNIILSAKLVAHFTDVPVVEVQTK